MLVQSQAEAGLQSRRLHRDLGPPAWPAPFTRHNQSAPEYTGAL